MFGLKDLMLLKLLSIGIFLSSLIFAEMSIKKENLAKVVKINKPQPKKDILVVPVVIKNAVYFNNTVRATLINNSKIGQKYFPIFEGGYTDCVKKTMDYCAEYIKTHPNMICTPTCIDGNIGIERVKASPIFVPAKSSKELRIYNIPTHNYQGTYIIIGNVKVKCKLDNRKQVN